MKPELVAPHGRQPVVCEAVEALAIERDGARRRPIEPADQVEQRRFARTGRPDDRHQLALGNVEVDVLERGDAPASFEMFGDVVERLNEGVRSHVYGRESWRPSYSSMRVRAQSGTGTGFAEE